MRRPRPARQQQVRDVRAREEQQQTDERHQHCKWLLVLAAQRGQPAGGAVEHDMRIEQIVSADRIRNLLSFLIKVLMERQIDRRVRLRERHAGMQPSGDV